VLSLLAEAPDFTASGRSGRGEPVEVRLSARRGGWVVLFFYPRDFTSICPTEVRELSKRRGELGAEVLALSVDDPETHGRWIGEVLGEVGFPLLADPGGDIARAYGVLLEPDGVAARATFAIDPGGLVQYAAAHSLNVGRSISELVRVMEALRTGQPVPAGWQPGQPTLGG
jgi:peroxiredoxin (alkyl hydroperoxide reductase subunit C)